MFAPRQPTSSWLAILLAACVVLLGLANQSPGLHQRLCGETHGAQISDSCDHHEASAQAAPDPSDDHTGHTAPGHEHGCAVTLFAAGCETIAAFDIPLPLALTPESVDGFIELLLSRTLRGPERVCGPPAHA